MVKTSKRTKDLVKEQLLWALFDARNAMELPNTLQLSQKVARSDDFTLSLLQELQGAKLVLGTLKRFNEGKHGRARVWRLTDRAFEVMKLKEADVN